MAAPILSRSRCRRCRFLFLSTKDKKNRRMSESLSACRHLSMKIAMLSSEIAPFAKTGGLADVLGTLSVALEKRGHEICAIMPAYRCVLNGPFALDETGMQLAVPLGAAVEE